MLTGLENDPIPGPENPNRPAKWAESPEVVKQHIEALAELAQRDFVYPAGSRKGSGMLICGGGKYWLGAVLAAKMLRHVGSDLPIQIWHRGDDEPVELSYLDGVEGVTVINCYEFAKTHPARILRGWEVKLYAMLHSGWESILYLDADAYPVANPEKLIQLAQSTGIAYWTDLPGNYGTVKWPKVWPPGENKIPAIQGGQMAIHLPTFWKEFMLAHWMNQHSDYFYTHGYGDQDTWRIACAITGNPGKNLGPAGWKNISFICHLDKIPTVVHRCRGKLFRPEDIPPGKTTWSNPQYYLPLEDVVFGYMTQVLSTNRDPNRTFSAIYANGLWGGGSGAGSRGIEAHKYCVFLNPLIGFLNAKTVVDIGCGDGTIAAMLAGEKYIGVDVVEPILARLRGDKKFAGKEFICADFLADFDAIPEGDLWVCKDVLHHLPNDMVTAFMTRLVASTKWKHVLITTDCQQRAESPDCFLGGYRALSLSMYPLNQFRLRSVYRYDHKEIFTVDR